jgi:pimeloyl-ACP methyl ester carboxylesterase
VGGLGGSVALYPVRLFRRFAWPGPRPAIDTPEAHGLTPEPFEVVAADGVHIHGWVFRPARPWGVVIVCHARNASKSRTLGHARLLFDQGLAVVTFDFRGCGDSDQPRRRIWGSLWDPLRDLEAVARHVESRFDTRGGTPMALLGCSFGGNMAIAHAGTTGRRYPAVVLDSTPLVRWVDMLDGLLRQERSAARFARIRGAVDWLVVRCVVAWTRAGPLYRHAKRSVRNLRGTTVLHIVGDRDTLFDVDESCQFLRSDCTGEVTIWRVPRGRHLTNHVVDPGGYARRVTDCLGAAFGGTRALLVTTPTGDPDVAD